MALVTIMAGGQLVYSVLLNLWFLPHRRVPLLTKQGLLPLPLVQDFAAVVFVSVRDECRDEYFVYDCMGKPVSTTM